MRFHSVDYSKDRHGETGLVNRGFWFYLPRPLVTCHLLGHKPVVDGTEGFRGRPGHRWACCDRCGVRPEPQGNFVSTAEIGAPVAAPDMPGPWPAKAEGTIGGQIVIGRKAGCGVSVKVGNAGSEHTLAGHVAVPLLGALYLHTERFGTWLQRQLVPEGYESRVIEASVFDRHLSWGLWAPRDSGSRQGWRAGYVKVDPRDIVLGEKRYSYTDEGAPVTVTVTLPEGDSHEVTMQLQRQSLGRREGRKKLAWTVDCDNQPGISQRPGWKDGLCGWSVPVSDDAVEAGRWAQEAAAACVVKITGSRTRYGWKPPVAAA
jgi:hypothetical protein